MTQGHIFIRNYLSHIEIPVIFNGQILETKKKLVYETSIGQVYVTEEVSVPSIIMTNRIPFQSIDFLWNQVNVHPNLKQIATTQVIINFNKNIYTPVQSRTKIKLDSHLEQQLQEFVNDGLFMVFATLYAEKNHAAL